MRNTDEWLLLCLAQPRSNEKKRCIVWVCASVGVYLHVLIGRLCRKCPNKDMLQRGNSPSTTMETSVYLRLSICPFKSSWSCSCFCLVFCCCVFVFCSLFFCILCYCYKTYNLSCCCARQHNKITVALPEYKIIVLVAFNIK